MMRVFFGFNLINSLNPIVFVKLIAYIILSRHFTSFTESFFAEWNPFETAALLLYN